MYGFIRINITPLHSIKKKNKNNVTERVIVSDIENNPTRFVYQVFNTEVYILFRLNKQITLHHMMLNEK